MKLFEILNPSNKTLFLPFETFEEAVEKVVPGYDIVAEYDDAVAVQGEYPASISYTGGVLSARITRVDPKDPISRYVRTEVSRPARLDERLIEFIQSAIDSGHLTSPGLCRTGEGVSWGIQSPETGAAP